MLKTKKNVRKTTLIFFKTIKKVAKGKKKFEQIILYLIIITFNDILNSSNQNIFQRYKIIERNSVFATNSDFLIPGILATQCPRHSVFQMINSVQNFEFEIWFTQSVAEFKEFERRFKFKPRFKYGWFHLKLYQMFQNLNRLLI